MDSEKKEGFPIHKGYHEFHHLLPLPISQDTRIYSIQTHKHTAIMLNKTKQHDAT